MKVKVSIPGDLDRVGGREVVTVVKAKNVFLPQLLMAASGVNRINIISL